MRSTASSPLPLYHKVYMVLRQRLLDGEFPAGAAMPTEQELGEQFNVSRITVRRAMDELESEGLILRKRGKGTFPTTNVGTVPIQASISGLLENLIAMGLKTQARMIEFGYVPASREVQAALEVEEGALVQRSVRVRSYQGTPFSHLTAFVPEDIGRSYREEDLRRHALLSLLERGGVRVASADQSITAKLADADVAALLGVEIGAPLIAISRQVRDINERPVEYIKALYRPDQYEYRMRVTRVTEADTRLWSADPGTS